MAQAILLPKQGQSVESCIITEFYVKVGDDVSAGTPLFAYETDKASFEEESQAEGKILALFYKAGDEVPVLTNVGVIGAEGESVDEFAADGATEGKDDSAVKEVADSKAEESNSKAEEEKEIKETSTQQSATSGEGGRIFISPRARNLADKEGLSISTLNGSGPNGRIIVEDVKKALESMPKRTVLAEKMMKEEGVVSTGSATGIGQKVSSQDLGPANIIYSSDSEIKPLTNIRKLIAKAMHNSLQNSAQLTHHLSADARAIMDARQKVKAAQKDGYAYNITLNDMICASVIDTLKEFPQANAHFLGESVREFSKVHLGLAVDTERGLMVPAIKNSDDLSIEGLSSQIKAVADACRTGGIDPDLLSPEAASFTVSNLGNYGVEMFTPVINLPQVAILGVNTILPRPKDLGNGIYGFVPHLGLSLTYDHQALDGGEATRFLKSIAVAIENFELTI
ncbi:dihydrolipoamide acetyltransferase family protein [Bacteroidota bacterium]